MSGPPIPNGLYYIQSVATNTRINLSQGSPMNYTPIIGWAAQPSGATNDQWNVVASAAAPYTYTFSNKAATTVLQAGAPAPDSGEWTDLYHGPLFGMSHTTPNPILWKITPSSTAGQYTIGYSDVLLNIWDSGENVYSPITLEPSNGKANQLWTFTAPT